MTAFRVEVPTRRVRWVRTAAVLAGAGLRPGTSRRGAVCAAARLLTSLGVRVEVHAPRIAWPRPRPGAGLLVVANAGSALDHLALVTAVPGVVAVDRGRGGHVPGALRLPTVPATPAAVTAALRTGTVVTVRPEPAGGGRPGGFDPALLAPALDTGAAVCPVAVRHRAGPAGTPPAAPGRTLLRELPAVLAAPDLVVELHLLPALDAAGDAGELATLAGNALAGRPGTAPVSAR